MSSGFIRFRCISAMRRRSSTTIWLWRVMAPPICRLPLPCRLPRRGRRVGVNHVAPVWLGGVGGGVHGTDATLPVREARAEVVWCATRRWQHWRLCGRHVGRRRAVPPRLVRPPRLDEVQQRGDGPPDGLILVGSGERPHIDRRGTPPHRVGPRTHESARRILHPAHGHSFVGIGPNAGFHGVGRTHRRHWRRHWHHW